MAEPGFRTLFRGCQIPIAAAKASLRLAEGELERARLRLKQEQGRKQSG